MDVHGVLYEDNAGRFVIPLTFPGGRRSGLRNSYLEYLKEGLALAEQRAGLTVPSEA